MKHTTPLKRDKYKSKRGGHSRLCDIHCRACNQFTLVYQKDGPGNLLRLYMDRISEPASLTGLEHIDIDKIEMLRCSGCNKLLGTPYIYEKERRKAFRLHTNAVIKRQKK